MSMRALVTGASSGIGRDIACELDKLGYSLVLVGRDRSELQKTADQLHNHAEIFVSDLKDEKACMRLHSSVSDIDVLVNNAGVGVFGEFVSCDLKKELDLIKTNVVALHILTKLYLKDMMQNNAGYILNVASITGFMPGPLMAAYYASKAYVVSLSESIRAELKSAHSQVHISILCPGPVITDFNRRAGVDKNLGSLSSSYVAHYAVKRLFKRRFLILPGKSAKFLRLVAKIVPSGILGSCVALVQKRRRPR